MRLLEVLAGQASVALENARLYEQQRHEAESAKALLAFADVVSRAHIVRGDLRAHGRRPRRPSSRPRRVTVARRHLRGELGRARRREGARALLAEGDGFWDGWCSSSTAGSTRTASGCWRRFTYQASVALQKARLYWKQREAAEIANSLLEASRELATAESPDDVLARCVEVTARVPRHRARRAVDPGRRVRPSDLVARRRRLCAGVDPVDGRRFPRRSHRVARRRTEPFVLEREMVVAHMTGVDLTNGSIASSSRRSSSKAEACRRPDRDGRRSTSRRPRDSPACRPRPSGEARDRERRALRGARAHLRLDLAVARERTRGE